MKTLVLISSCLAMFFTLPGHTEYCFSLDGKTSQKLWGAYIISGEGDMNVLSRLYNSQRKAKYISPKKTREGKFDIILDHDETYNFCFKSLDSYTKTISFEYSQDENKEELILAGEDQFQPINDEVLTASSLLESIYRNLHFYERRERVHRDLTEKTCDSILLSVLIKIIILCLLSLIQIYVLKSLFNTNKTKI